MNEKNIIEFFLLKVTNTNTHTNTILTIKHERIKHTTLASYYEPLDTAPRKRRQI